MAYRSLVILLVAVAFTACGTRVRTIAADHRLGASNESVVIGRMELVRRDGRPFGTVAAWLLGRMVVTAIREADDRTYKITCDATGYTSDFYVSLPPGRYRVTEWMVPGGFEGKVRASFEVPPSQVIYIGTLRWTETSVDLVLIRGRWTVHDEAEARLPAFRERFPALGKQVTTSPALLMRLTQ